MRGGERQRDDLGFAAMGSYRGAAGGRELVPVEERTPGDRLASAAGFTVILSPVIGLFAMIACWQFVDSEGRGAADLGVFAIGAFAAAFSTAIWCRRVRVSPAVGVALSLSALVLTFGLALAVVLIGHAFTLDWSSVNRD